MRNQRILTPVLLIGFTWVIAFLCFTFFVFNFSHPIVSSEPARLLEGNLHEEQSAQTRILSITLPEDFNEKQSILFKTTHTTVDVSVGRENVYVCGTENNPPFMKSPGALWHIVDLPEHSAGKTLSIYISSVYEDYYGNDPLIRYGSNEGCSLYLLMTSFPIVLINSIVLFVGIVCLILHNFGWLRKNGVAKNSFLFVGLFALTIAAWSLCQSGFLQFLIPDGPTLYLIDFLSFYLFPATFNLFVASIFKGRGESVFCWLSGAYLLTMTVSALLQVLGVADMFELLRIGHFIMLINVFCVFFFTHEETHKEHNAMAKKFRLPLYVVIAFAACELVLYYVRDFRQTSVFIPMGTIVFIFMLASQLISQYYQNLLEEEKVAYFKKLANTDMLTEVFNRNAYEDRLRSLEKQELELRTTCVVLFDINNMKMINDHYGHERGDIALKTCCRCILNAFGSDGACYRIGGDEFVYLCNSSDTLAHCAARFGEIVRQEARQLDFPFRVAIGYASYDPEKDHSLRDLISRSDEMMYRNKEFQKKYDAPIDFSTAATVSVDI